MVKTTIVVYRRYPMSKCKAVLDGEKITEIRVKIKGQESPQADVLEPKHSEESAQSFVATSQSSE